MLIPSQEATVCDLWARTVSHAPEETTSSRPHSLTVLRHRENRSVPKDLTAIPKGPFQVQ